MKKINAPSILVIILLLFPVFTGSGLRQLPEDINFVFSVSFLSPDGCHSCMHWSLLIENQLPKIGIYIDFHNWTNGESVGTRTWNYPFIDYDYIPTYDEGGYDILFNRFKWDLDPDIAGKYDSSSLTPLGPNFLQYASAAYDAKLVQYLFEINQTLRALYFHELQNILFEDLPVISILYGKTLCGRRTTVTGVDWDLLYQNSERPELWNETGDQILTYLTGWNLEAQNIYRYKTNPIDSQWMNAVYGRLFQREQISHYWEPEIALNYTVSSDLLNYTINLDPNAKFSDGSPVLGEDIEYSFRLHLTPMVNSTKYSEFNSWFSSNQSIEAIDTHKLNFNFSRFCYSPFTVLSEGIIDKSDIESLISTHGYSIFEEIPLTGNVTDSLVKSCGPFKLDQFEPMSNNTVKMVPNEYWNNLTSSGGNDPLLKEYYLTVTSGRYFAVSLLESGDAEILGYCYYSSQHDYTGKPQIQYELAKTGHQADMSINMRHPIMGTGELTPLGTPEAAKKVRKAISHAIPREIIAEQICDNLAAPGTTPIADACVGYNESMEPYVYDLELAIDYIEQAGYEVRITPTKTSFTILLSMIIGLTTISMLRKRKK